jgi:spoIIIJ-associated protein
MANIRERVEIFTAKTLDEAHEMAAAEFGAEVSDITFEVIESPKKGLFGTKGEFRVRAIYTPSANSFDAVQMTANSGRNSGSNPDRPSSAASAPAETPSAPRKPMQVITDSAQLEKFKPTVDYVDGILAQLGVGKYEIAVKKEGDNNVIDISGENLGAIIGRRGETLDALQYLAILANNRGSEENTRLRLVVDCNGYREKRTETLETLAVRTCAKVIKQGRRVTLEPMNPYERRIIHSKVSEIEGVFSNSIGDEPYRKVVISAERVKPRERNDGGRDNRDGRDNRERRDNRDNRGGRGGGGGFRGRSDNDVIPQRIPGEVANAVHSKSYKQSSGYATSFEREYKRGFDDAPVDAPILQEVIDVEKSTALYGKIEL